MKGRPLVPPRSSGQGIWGQPTLQTLLTFAVWVRSARKPGAPRRPLRAGHSQCSLWLWPLGQLRGGGSCLLPLPSHPRGALGPVPPGAEAAGLTSEQWWPRCGARTPCPGPPISAPSCYRWTHFCCPHKPLQLFPSSPWEANLRKRASEQGHCHLVFYSRRGSVLLKRLSSPGAIQVGFGWPFVGKLLITQNLAFNRPDI